MSISLSLSVSHSDCLIPQLKVIYRLFYSIIRSHMDFYMVFGSDLTQLDLTQSTAIHQAVCFFFVCL